jgi:hypothetical protein
MPNCLAKKVTEGVHQEVTLPKIMGKRTKSVIDIASRWGMRAQPLHNESPAAVGRRPFMFIGLPLSSATANPGATRAGPLRENGYR